MHPGLRRMLTQSVRVQRQDGASDYGDPAWGAMSDPIPARIEPTTKIVMAPMGGQAFQAEILVIIESGIQPEDRVWLPGRTEPRTARSVFEVPEALSDRIDHLEVYL
ncbi:MAG TPA: hypothetical protein VGD74_02315 [Vulgatibacter sp.]